MNYFFHAATLAALAFVILSTTLIGRCLMATQADVDKLTGQVVKIGVEVKTAHAVLLSELTDLKAQLAAAGAAEKVDLTGLAAAIQNVDDIHPDPDVKPEVEGEPDEDDDEDEDEDVATEPVAVDEPVAEDAAVVE